jgi:hypothetical protein
LSDTKLRRSGIRVFLDLPDLLPVPEPKTYASTRSVQRPLED